MPVHVVPAVLAERHDEVVGEAHRDVEQRAVTGAADLGHTFAPFAEIAKERGVSPQVVCLAWELGLADVVVPIPGASRPETITDSATAPDLELSSDEMDRLNAVA